MSTRSNDYQRISRKFQSTGRPSGGSSFWGVALGVGTVAGVLSVFAVTRTTVHLEGNAGPLVKSNSKDGHDSSWSLSTIVGMLSRSDSSKDCRAGKKRSVSSSSGLPLFERAEVRSHNSKEKGIWVTRGDKVYDITKFVDIHPGGERILLAAGRSIDPFWAIFSIHQSESTAELLEQYRIGDLIPMADDPSSNDGADDPSNALAALFSNEPERHPSLIVHASKPCNAESPPEALTQSFTTPNELFYVRNHLPVPKIDEKEFRLKIDVPGRKEGLSLTLEDLKTRFPKVTVMATLQCAGNRRQEMNSSKAVKGLLWRRGAIGNAVWSGVRLSDVLKAAGYEMEPDSNFAAGKKDGLVVPVGTPVDELEDASLTQHLILEGAEGYGASVPLVKVLNPFADVVLAYEMNGEPLPRDHGYPLRAVVPGHVAARSVKWLQKISVSDEESMSHWQRKDYKGFGPSKTLEESKYEASQSIQELPIQSAILFPKEGEQVSVVEAGGQRYIPVTGYAWSGGGRGIVRVDVSVDGGKTWNDAELLRRPGQPKGREWAWTQWETRVPVPKDAEVIEIICKAVDTSYNEQPERMESVYNVRGVLGLTAGHNILLAGGTGGSQSSPKEILESLMCPVGVDDAANADDDAKVEAQSWGGGRTMGFLRQDDSMRIAWRYQNMPKVKSGAADTDKKGSFPDFRSEEAYCFKFDITKTIAATMLAETAHLVVTVDMRDLVSTGEPSFVRLYKAMRHAVLGFHET
ncbi:hypothetical protein HK101_005321 [Irineochytrium annulatum]|nr:hypothetical protein HK101_005321 [Irineochytrium annulatum]